MNAPNTPVDDLDAAYAEIRKEPYRFTLGGREWTLPHMGDLDYRTLARIEAYTELGVTELLKLFSDVFSADQREAWNNTEVPTPQLYLLFERWTSHSGATLGEGQASSGSSGSTGKSSRRTSRASTSSASPKPSTAKRAPRKAATPPASSST